MELHPILERDNVPTTGIWYVVPSAGDRCPTMRVGHTITQVADKIYVIGGANPSGSFSEIYILDLKSMMWDTVDARGVFKARYEHTAYAPPSRPGFIYVFGGADQTGCNNDFQSFDTVTSTWTTVNVIGSPPSPRTYHNGATVGDRLIVYSGGQNGTDPVGDRQTYVFDASTHAWTTLPALRGDTPKPRLGHLLIAVGNRMFLHGGMSGSTFYDDLHMLDLNEVISSGAQGDQRGQGRGAGSWASVRQKKGAPVARSGHGGCVSGTDIYMFGGMNRDGALDDLYKFDTVSLKWSRILLDGPPPACRLDFAISTVHLPVLVTTLQTNDSAELIAQTHQLQEVLEEKLRLGSAGSGHSAGSTRSASSTHSAGNQRSPICEASSLAYVESTSLVSVLDECGPIDQSLSGDYNPAVKDSVVTEQELFGIQGQHAPEQSGRLVNGEKAFKMVEVVMVLGGMDTEGEIFDDCLVMTLRDCPAGSPTS